MICGRLGVQGPGGSMGVEHDSGLREVSSRGAESGREL